MQKLLTFFQKNSIVYAIFNDQSSNDTLTNDIVSFEQLGPGCWLSVSEILTTSTSPCFIKVISFDLHVFL